VGGRGWGLGGGLVPVVAGCVVLVFGVCCLLFKCVVVVYLIRGCRWASGVFVGVVVHLVGCLSWGVLICVFFWVLVLVGCLRFAVGCEGMGGCAHVSSFFVLFVKVCYVCV